MDWSTGLGLLVTVLGIAALVASTAAYFKVSFVKATIDTLKENNEALASRTAILESENARLKARVLDLETENTTLRSIATGEVAIRDGFAGLHLLIQELADRISPPPASPVPAPRGRQ